MQTNNSVVETSVRDSPSGRVTTPMAAINEDDEGDRDDGENWFEDNVERGMEKLPADKPLVIDDDEPNTKRD